MPLFNLYDLAWTGGTQYYTQETIAPCAIVPVKLKGLYFQGSLQACLDEEKNIDVPQSQIM